MSWTWRKKSGQSNKFWVSYGPLKYECKWSKSSFSWITPNILTFDYYTKKQKLFRIEFHMCVSNLVKIYWDLMESFANNYFRSALCKNRKRSMTIGVWIVHFVIKVPTLIQRIVSIYKVQAYLIPIVNPRWPPKIKDGRQES